MSTQSDLAEAAKCFCFNDATARAVVVYILLSKTGLLAMTPSELAIAAKNYSYDLDTWKKTVAYLLAVEAGLQGQTPAQLADASKCFCFNDGTWKKVVAYLLNAGGTESCPQDMQVAWTPTSEKLGQDLGFFTFGDIPGVTTITFNQATNLSGFDVEGGSNITELSWPNLVSIDPLNSQGGYIAINGLAALTTILFPKLTTMGGGNLTIVSCPLLTSLDFPSLTTSNGNLVCSSNGLVTVSIPVFLPTNGKNMDFSNNALSAASVNHILARGVASVGYVTGQVLLNAGTSAAPSGQGIADKATLIGRGVTVTTN